ncbi:type VII secretion target [Mycobacteroides abscessus]|uniref:type VII secretion target n=1 Tax=Mycobacteroides abscessus TaxID=36809 RepID=UPI0009297BC8|nr:type VII secretion target [Mycobacteroides abscessus]MBE5502396.1 hypothetical protein [Mycobacteroides abscessus]SIA27755.1 Protein of uncharacterised function (DUF2580) [Mycobacteroides abscessus subsp. abscessus]SKU60840.1 Protein of uncharacterised function (DUF2580) [Mycobacteroides abscessus subsp. massiliense]SLH57601.1 Protein of uncharacterised function (DUF2580) [Mycobacteroides abscessus subsp. massiliense]
MTDLEVDLGLLPNHANAHGDVADSYHRWTSGGDAHVSDVQSTHGEVAGAFAAKLQAFQTARMERGNQGAERHRGVQQAITGTLKDFSEGVEQSVDQYKRVAEGM